MKYTYPTAFEDIKADVSLMSDYYFLFGWITDDKGIYTSFYVDLKLPDGGHYPCITPERVETIQGVVESTMLESTMLEAYTAGGGGNPTIAKQLK